MAILPKIKPKKVIIDTVDIEEGLEVSDNTIAILKDNVERAIDFDVRKAEAMAQIQDLITQAVEKKVLINPKSKQFKEFGVLLKEVVMEVFLKNFGPDPKLLKAEKK